MKRSRRIGSHRSPRGAVLDFLVREKFSSLSPRAQRSLLEGVINQTLRDAPPEGDSLGLYGEMISEIDGFSTSGTKAVVFGGGTGLSTILGGDSTLPGWADSPYAGLKMLFEHLDVVVCVTDDGGSSGELVRRLPVIALGDIRRSVLSGITPRDLKRVYRTISEDQIAALPGILRILMNYRFGEKGRFAGRSRTSILSLLSRKNRDLLPEQLSVYLEEAWTHIRTHSVLSEISVRNHCLGNLLLVSEIYRNSSQRENNAGRRDKSGRKGIPRLCEIPDHRDVIDGIHRFARMVGAGWKTVWPISTRQGELQFLYSSGVVVTGEHKSSVSRRGFPVDHVRTEYIGGAQVDPRIIKAIEAADIIIIAPGSIYSSLIPIFQIDAVADAVRRNRRAIKVLGANFWVQKGETDITIRDLEKEFFVSDLIEAYNKNVEGGTAGLFNQVVTTNLENLPAETIQRYALEGKVPIYLDKGRVEKLGFEPLAVEVHSLERLKVGRVFQHDPEKFARTIRTLVYLKKYLSRKRSDRIRVKAARARKALRSKFQGTGRSLLLNEFMDEVEKTLEAMTIPSAKLKRLLPEMIWRNRDIRLEHLRYIRGFRVVPKHRWLRSTEWDRILAYYDPDDCFVNLRRDLLDADESRLEEDFLIGVGESLLGNYAAGKSTRPLYQGGLLLGKVFDITLRPERGLRSFLSPEKIREYLQLARLQAAPENPDLYSRLINNNESFTPPGLLFGLLYAWYLNNSFGCVIEYEMSLLKIATSDLIPKPSMNKDRLKMLIDFFRRDVFRH